MERERPPRSVARDGGISPPVHAPLVMHPELRARFLPPVDNPHLTVGVRIQLVAGQLLHVRIGQPRERAKQEDVAHDRGFVVRQVHVHNLPDLRLVEKAPFAGLGNNPYVRKRVELYPTLVESQIDHSVQFFERLENRSGAKSPDSGEIDDEFLGELPLQFPERNIAQSVFVLQKGGQTVAAEAVFHQRSRAAVFADPFPGELLQILVEGLQQ